MNQSINQEKLFGKYIIMFNGLSLKVQYSETLGLFSYLYIILPDRTVPEFLHYFDVFHDSVRSNRISNFGELEFL